MHPIRACKITKELKLFFVQVQFVRIYHVFIQNIGERDDHATVRKV